MEAKIYEVLKTANFDNTHCYECVESCDVVLPSGTLLSVGRYFSNLDNNYHYVWSTSQFKTREDFEFCGSPVHIIDQYKFDNEGNKL